MKKRNLFILTGLLILSMMLMTACGQDVEEAEGEISYTDGTYIEEGEKSEFGNEEVKIVIKDGKIGEVTLMRIDENGNEVDYKEWDGNSEDGKPDLKNAREEIAKEIIETQSSDVDIVSGATKSSENWIKLVNEALEKAK